MPYSIEPYNPEWIVEFEHIRKFLKKVFNTKALGIEHIGSTSIVGMKSKPLIDVLVVVQKLEPFEKERELMIEAGYEWAENYIAPGTLLFYKTDGDRKTENIHICAEGSPKAVQFLDARDYLRAHPDRAEKYGELKEKLFAQFPNDYPAYRSAKKNFIDETEVLAQEWKRNQKA